MSNSPFRALSVSQLSLRASRWPSGLARFHSAQADPVRHFDAQRSLFSVQTETNTHAESCQGYTARSLGKRVKPQVHDQGYITWRRKARMTAFLVFFGLTALLVVGGVRGSLRLSTGRRVSGLRRSYAAPKHDTTEDEIARHSRKAWVTWCTCKL